MSKSVLTRAFIAVAALVLAAGRSSRTNARATGSHHRRRDAHESDRWNPETTQRLVRLSRNREEDGTVDSRTCE